VKQILLFLIISTAIGTLMAMVLLEGLKREHRRSHIVCEHHKMLGYHTGDCGQL
jgi:hypothetical protein